MIKNVAWLYWDPPREAFTIPFLDIPVAWYGILFAAGFAIGYFILLPILNRTILQSTFISLHDINNWEILLDYFRNEKNEIFQIKNKTARQELKILLKGSEPSANLKHSLLEALNNPLIEPTKNLTRQSLDKLFPGAFIPTPRLSTMFADRLTWFIVIGTIIGARLGHVFFYDWPYYEANPIEIFMIRKGGLASHGGTLGVLIGLLLFLKWNNKLTPKLSLISLIDLLTIPTSFTIFCIRLGNFFNQEILGNETLQPWAVIFGHPADGAAVVPRHPAQLYEAFVYLFTFCLLYGVWTLRGSTLKPGTLGGIFFTLVFTSRFFIEFLKRPQSMLIDETFLQMGQYLSLPFILLGLILLIASRPFSKSRGLLLGSKNGS